MRKLFIYSLGRDLNATILLIKIFTCQETSFHFDCFEAKQQQQEKRKKKMH